MKRLKHRKPIVYISLVLYASLSLLIIVESFIAGGLSGLQSDLFSKISAFFVNLIEGPQIGEVIRPSELSLNSDTTYLGTSEDGYAQIAIGTTSRIIFDVAYPERKNSNDSFDYSYDFVNFVGNKDDYNMVFYSSRNENKMQIILRIVANKMSSPSYTVDLLVGQEKSYTYKFNIVDLPAPKEYESTLTKTELKIGESVTINTKLTGENRKDTYLRRYFDVTKLDFSSSNTSVATIDKYGVIKGISNGTSTIKYGKCTYNITVNNQSVPAPISNNLDLVKSATASQSLSLLDYDYIFEEGEDSSMYSALVYADFEDDELNQYGVSWSVSNNLQAKIAPFKYDENDYPIYFDDEGKPCARICGYREKGDVTLTCTSNFDSTITQDIVLNVDEASPVSMDIAIEDEKELRVNEQLIISATFLPKNTHDVSLHAVSSDENVVKVNVNDSTSITITAIGIGSADITISSIKNPSLTKTIKINAIAGQAINDNNFESFKMFIRKFIGHFALFLITGIFGAIFFYTYVDDIKKLKWVILLSTLPGIALAGLSELIQLMVPGRTGAIADVGIDSLGFVIGALLTLGIILLIRLIIKKIKERKEAKEK